MLSKQIRAPIPNANILTLRINEVQIFDVVPVQATICKDKWQSWSYHNNHTGSLYIDQRKALQCKIYTIQFIVTHAFRDKTTQNTIDIDRIIIKLSLNRRAPTNGVVAI